MVSVRSEGGGTTVVTMKSEERQNPDMAFLQRVDTIDMVLDCRIPPLAVVNEAETEFRTLVVTPVEVRNAHTHWLSSLNAGDEARNALSAVLGVIHRHSCGMRARYLSRFGGFPVWYQRLNVTELRTPMVSMCLISKPVPSSVYHHQAIRTCRWIWLRRSSILLSGMLYT